MEHARFDAGFFADGLGLPDFYRNSFADYIGRGGQASLLDPMTVLPLMARVTTRLGLGATLSTAFDGDLLSKGRTAWNVATSAIDYEARNCDMAGLPPKDLRYDRADEVQEACSALWGLLGRGRAGPGSRERCLRRCGQDSLCRLHRPLSVSTREPMSIPRSPQGRPVLLARSSPRGCAFAAR